MAKVATTSEASASLCVYIVICARMVGELDPTNKIHFL